MHLWNLGLIGSLMIIFVIFLICIPAHGLLFRTYVIKLSTFYRHYFGTVLTIKSTYIG
mgnify:CR=1 FL=1